MANGNRVKAYWDKSCEHWAVGDSASADERYSAAASRYYYALRFAAGAVLLSRTGNDYLPKPNSHWDLIAASDQYLRDIGVDLKKRFIKMKVLREKGDYKPVPVTQYELELVLREITKIVSLIGKELQPA